MIDVFVTIDMEFCSARSADLRCCWSLFRR